MTGLAQGAAGLAVALGFALVGTRRTGGLALLCAAQAVVVALGALAQGDVAVALAEFVEAAALWRLRGMSRNSRLPLPLWEGGWGEGSGGARTPPPNPLPQGEGESWCWLLARFSPRSPRLSREPVSRSR